MGKITVGTLILDFLVDRSADWACHVVSTKRSRVLGAGLSLSESMSNHSIANLIAASPS